MPAQARRLRLGYLVGELNITGRQRGFGALAADFFRVRGGARARGGTILGRYRSSRKSTLPPRVAPYLWPGPDGPASTMRLELMREGLMECEARITVEAALRDKADRARLGARKTRAFEALLSERSRWARRALSVPGGLTFIGSDWRGRRSALFDAAAEVDRLAGR
jgi:hypothetical protein